MGIYIWEEGSGGNRRAAVSLVGVGAMVTFLGPEQAARDMSMATTGISFIVVICTTNIKNLPRASVRGCKLTLKSIQPA